MWTLVHGDDYCSAGDGSALLWLEGVFSKKYELKTQKVGHLPGMVREGQILNRIVRATSAGFELEADPRHAELIVEQLNFTAAKCVVTPGTDDQDEDDEQANEFLDPTEAKAFRGMAARCNYLSVDRPDILFPVKEFRGEMSVPKSRSMDRFKCVGRYLKPRPRVVWEYLWQTRTTF